MKRGRRMSGLRMIKKGFRYILDPAYRTCVDARWGKYDHLSDEDYLKKIFCARVGKELDLENPQTFNEKLQWLKLHDRKPEYTVMVDKYAAKQYAAERIGEQYIIPTLGVWDRFEDIDFDSLPEQFVLKCTHDSGGLVVCKDKGTLNKAKAEKKIGKSLKRNFYLRCREWPYKNVPPRILAEKYMRDRDFEVLNVYKIFNFDGVPKLIQAIQGDKTRDESIDYFDTAWNKLELRQNFPNSKHALPKPDTLEEMLSLARKLSSGHSFLRTDFYEVNGRVYFSEFTFYSDAGFVPYRPEEWDYKLGSWLTLPAGRTNG